MFGIEIATIKMHRQCCTCGHEHKCDAYYVRSTVPLHLELGRPGRSLIWWWGS